MGMAKQDFGEPLRFDPDFTGPTKRRSCTDLVFLLMFAAGMIGWGISAYFALTRGDVRSLISPMDSDGYRCGVDSNVMDKPNLVFFNITQCLSLNTALAGCNTPQVCVESCPTVSMIFVQYLNQYPNQWQTARDNLVCKYNVDTTQITSAAQILTLIESEQCASYVIESESVLGRCLPLNLFEDSSILDELNVSDVESILEGLNSNVGEVSSLIIADLVQSRWYLLGGFLAVLIICLIYILLIRWIVSPLVWTSIVLFLGLLGFSIYLCYIQYDYYTKNPVYLYQTSNLLSYLESQFHKPGVWMTLLVITSIVFVILLLIVIFLRKRITIAIALIREGSKAVSAVKTSVLFPVFPWVFQCAVMAFFLVVLCYLMSIGENRYRAVNINGCTCAGYENGDSCYPENFTCVGTCTNATCHYAGVLQPSYVTWLHVYNAFAFFWLMFFLHGMSDMILACTFATWYWTFNKRNLPFFTLSKGIWTVIRYHLGTIAFGSLLLAIVRLIRVILEYIDSKLKKYDNAVTKCLMCFCKCFLYCLENFIKFINKNAYIMCAIHGKGFCRSARDAFSLLMRNILRVVVVDKVTDFLFFLSKLVITIGIGFAVYYLQRWNYIYEVTGGNRLSYPQVPAVILAVGAFLISTICFNVYSMAVDTLFLCFLEDSERNDGSPDKPYFMSKNLLRILKKKNKIH